MITKTKKSKRMRGSRTHGWGGQKKHRGAGSRGGKGMAGVGKRGAQKKTKYLSILKKVPTGKSGIQNKRQGPKVVAINLYQIEENVDRWVDMSRAKKVKDVYEINLKALGFDKVLGAGEVTRKLKIKVDSISKSAAEKIKIAGGEIVK